jgi:hypothetical protein
MIGYLSGLYTTGDIKQNIADARKIAIELWEKGYPCFVPHLNTAHFEIDCKCKYEDYMDFDIEMLSRCDYIVMMPKWELSKGASKEKEFAKYLRMPIYYYPEVPLQRMRMSDDQEAHLAQVINMLIRDINIKYADGQLRHGGNLYDKPNLPMLLEEVQDMAVYAYTLRSQIEKAITRSLEGDSMEAYNILRYGNEDGRELKDND